MDNFYVDLVEACYSVDNVLVVLDELRINDNKYV